MPASSRITHAPGPLTNEPVCQVLMLHALRHRNIVQFYGMLDSHHCSHCSQLDQTVKTAKCYQDQCFWQSAPTCLRHVAWAAMMTASAHCYSPTAWKLCSAGAVLEPDSFFIVTELMTGGAALLSGAPHAVLHASYWHVRMSPDALHAALGAADLPAGSSALREPHACMCLWQVGTCTRPCGGAQS